MKDIIFKRTELEDKKIMTKYFDEHPSRSCERTFVFMVQAVPGKMGDC